MKFLTAAVFLFLIPFSSFLWADTSWELRKNEKGIQVFTREVEGSALLEFRGIVTVDQKIDEVVAFYEDWARMPEWFHQCIESKLLEEKSPDSKILYFAIDLPWPVKDRDSVYHRVRTKGQDGGVEYHASAMNDLYPSQKDRVRMPAVSGMWRFTPLADGRTEVYYQQHGDAGGFIPAWLMNKLVVNIPYNTLSSLREALKEPKPEQRRNA